MVDAFILVINVILKFNSLYELLLTKTGISLIRFDRRRNISSQLKDSEVRIQGIQKLFRSSDLDEILVVQYQEVLDFRSIADILSAST